MTAKCSKNLMEFIAQGEFILMDGALGTELERRGVPFEETGWSAIAVRDHADVIRQIHKDFLQAGARLHIVNSFALARHVLEPIGLGQDFASLNRRSVELFDEAVAGSGHNRSDFWAAGSLSTFAASSDRSLLPVGDELKANFRDQACILQEAGVDLFALEMLFDTETSLTMMDAVSDLGLPVIAGFTCEWNRGSGSSVVTARGMGIAPAPLSEILPRIIEAGSSMPLILSIMHSDLDVTDAALEVLGEHWDGPVAVYPNSGDFIDLRMQFDTVCSIEDFQNAASRWISQGIQIVGGCCGLGPEHIKGIAYFK